MLVQDYQSAIEDLNQVLYRKDNFILAYFNRAVIRFRQIEVTEHSGTVSASGNSQQIVDEVKPGEAEVRMFLRDPAVEVDRPAVV